MQERTNTDCETQYESLVNQIAEREGKSPVPGASMSPLEAMVLRCLYGLDGVPQRSYEELAKELEVTPERIHQIEKMALRRLFYVHVCRKRSFKDFLD